MNLKRFSAAALAMVMTIALLPAALCADLPEGWTPADGARELPQAEPMDAPLADSYHTWLFLNDEYLDASNIPDVRHEPDYLLPMRLLAEADGGMAEWYPEDNEGYFSFADNSIIVSFADNSVMVDFEKAEGVTATVIDGVTFLPAGFVDSLEGVEVDLNPAMNVDRVDVRTPNGTPLMKLANQIMEVADMGRGMRTTPAELEDTYGEALGFQAEYMTEGVIFLPMMVSPDTLALGKAAEGKVDALKESFEAFRKNQEDTFSWYLSQNLPKVQNAKFVTSGEWFMFLIAENADEAVTAFEAAVEAMEK